MNSMSRSRPDERPAGSQAGVPEPFRVVVRIERDVVRVCAFGEVDIETAAQISERLEEATARGARHVVLDLRGVTFLDSTGLHMVLEADAASRARGWQFGLVGGPPDVQRVFDLTGSRARLPFLAASQLSALLRAPGDSRA